MRGHLWATGASVSGDAGGYFRRRGCTSVSIRIVVGSSYTSLSLGKLADKPTVPQYGQRRKTQVDCQDSAHKYRAGMDAEASR